MMTDLQRNEIRRLLDGAPPEECDPKWNEMTEADAEELITLLASIDPEAEEMASATASQNWAANQEVSA